jgi:hypothetical protein
MNLDLLMITRWWSPLSQVFEGVVFDDLFHFHINGDFQVCVTIGSMNSQSILSILGNKCAKFVGGAWTMSGLQKFGLLCHLSKLVDFQGCNACQ